MISINASIDNAMIEGATRYKKANVAKYFRAMCLLIMVNINPLQGFVLMFILTD